MHSNIKGIKMTKLHILSTITISFFLIGCAGTNLNSDKLHLGENTIKNGIETIIPQSLKSDYGKYFDRYTKVVAPNQKPIHILAQETITDEQIIRVRSVLEHFLRDYAGSIYGSDKSKVANQMAMNHATILLLNGSDGDESSTNHLEGQPLYKNEVQVEGGEWYTKQNYDHRDATYEEILHLVHDTGIGVDGENVYPGTLAKFQQEIRDAQVYALNNNIWGINVKDWIDELKQENSLSQEYLASLVDAYYGLWGAWKESSTSSMWGVYTPRDRDAIKIEDRFGNELMNNKFFHPYLTYNARIDAGFKGVFSLKFNDKIPYTYHSRYLKDITLLGTKNTSIVPNELSNHLTGNSGINTVVFSGNSNEYKVLIKKGEASISDSIANRDGKLNLLKYIEKIQFLDITMSI
ncbi:MAG: hypothetical protein ACI9RG_000447 [Sulfurimonas sp.]